MNRTGALTVLVLSFGIQTSANNQAATSNATSAPEITPPAAEGGPRRWRVSTSTTLDVRETPSSGAAVVEDAKDGTLYSNLGCEAHDDVVWCHVERTRGRIQGYALADQLRPVLGKDGTVLLGINDSARRARKRKFDTQGEVACSQERGQELGTCSANIANSGGGDAAIVVIFANGFKRTLYFMRGEFISADATMSGTGSDTDWRKEGDRHIIRVDDQRYELHIDLVVGH